MTKILILSLALAFASPVFAGWGYANPRSGGGYNYQSYDTNGNSTWGYSTPRFGGGYNYNTYGN